MKRCTICAVVLVLSGLATVSWSAETANRAARPRAGRDPLTIPEVARDRVICFCLYTAHAGVLKLTAQFYPLKPGEAARADLQVRDGDVWKTIAEAQINPDGWMATFRVPDWDATRDREYQVTHANGARYAGRIRRNPVEKEEIVVAFFTGNSNSDRGPREDIVRNVKAQDPDLLFFSGDQSYDHKEHTAAWLLFGRQFGEIIRDRPTVTIPDDHDVGQGNLWGEGGGTARRPDGADGGYVMPPEYVRMVERAQTSHLPDPYDATPVKNGIGVYYTALQVGGIDFAIIEDRKWKTGPAGLVPQQGPRPDHINDPAYDRAAIDLPEAQLLGERQLKFLREWGQRWEGVEMKAVLSQTIFGGGAHLHGSRENRLLADLDSNGWPQSGRAAALREIRRCFGFMMGGDQHLATVIHHGINEWEDAGWSFGCPSIWNYYGRWWEPLEEPRAHDEKSALPYTGRYYDGFGNKLTVHAYANPQAENHRAAGYALVRFRKGTRQIVMECWPRFVDVTAADARQFPGWPLTIQQQENYARRPLARLPELNIVGQGDSIVQVVEEDSGEIVYTLRIKGNRFQPSVFKEGKYTVHVGEGPARRTLRGIETAPPGSAEPIEVKLNSKAQ